MFITNILIYILQEVDHNFFLKIFIPVISLCQGQCTPHARFPLTKGGGLISGSPLLGRTGGVVELVLGSVFIIELDTGLAGIYFHRYYTEYDVCHKQNT